MTAQEVRSEFPELDVKIYGRNLVYLDNAATSLRPRCVIDKWTWMSSECNANLHRAVHKIAADTTEEYETSRDAVRDFINAADRREIVFTSGATASINLVAYSFGEKFIGEGDEIIVTEEEHHSNIVPWQMLCRRKNAILKVLPVDDSGRLDINLLGDMITPRTKLFCVAHISNVLGLVNPVRELADICHSKGCLILVDGAQGIVHEKVDVERLDCDFYAFSGHKMYAAPGTGVLYGKYDILSKLPPFMGGGEMIETVSFKSTEFAGIPQRFEAGTQNISGIPTFKPAIGMSEKLREIDQSGITSYLLQALGNDERIRLFGIPDSKFSKIPLFSFSVIGAHHEDLALILDKMGIAVRSGQMCAEPLMDRMGVSGMLRASFAPYNTMEEAEYFMKCLGRAINMLSR